MKLVLWLAAVSVAAQVALIVLLGSDRAVAASGWVLAPTSLIGGCVAFYYWRRYRRGDLAEQPVPLLPLGLILLVSAVRYVPGVLGGAKGEVFIAAFAVLGLWFVVAEIQLLVRQYRAAIRDRAA